MKIEKVNLLEFLLKSPRLEVPVFHRSFVWGEKQLGFLWKNIEDLIKHPDTKSYFLGTIVFTEKDFNDISEFKTSFIIDGQQRLVALSLLILALSEESNTPNLKNSYLFNRIQNEFYPKLRLSKEDYDNLNHILRQEREFFENDSSNLVKAYKFFLRNIKSFNIKDQDLLVAISKLEFICVSLSKNYENPHIVFNGLNATGICIEEIDRIKNTILMALPQMQQYAAYYDHWKPMVDDFEVNKDKKLFERFLRDYLSIQNNGKVPSEGELYDDFEMFYSDRLKHQKPDEILKHLYQYSKYFMKLFKNGFIGKEADFISRINALNAEKAYPFLMEVTEDYEKKLISTEIFLEILKTIEIFVLNHMRTQADYSSQAFNELSKNISKMLVAKDFSVEEIDNNINKPLKIRDLYK